jgi:hypothetical protein
MQCFLSKLEHEGGDVAQKKMSFIINKPISQLTNSTKLKEYPYEKATYHIDSVLLRTWNSHGPNGT